MNDQPSTETTPSTPMTPAEELNAAADRLEEVGGKATKGVCPDWTWQAVRHVSRNVELECEHYDPHGSSDAPDDGLNHRGWRYDDAPWMSLLDPAVAPHLAGWLRAEAAVLELNRVVHVGVLPDPHSDLNPRTSHAVGFARLVLASGAGS